MPDGKGVYLPKSKDAWNLLRVLAREKGFEHLIASTDDTDEVLRRIEGFIPQYAPAGPLARRVLGIIQKMGLNTSAGSDVRYSTGTDLDTINPGVVLIAIEAESKRDGTGVGWPPWHSNRRHSRCAIDECQYTAIT